MEKVNIGHFAENNLWLIDSFKFSQDRESFLIKFNAQGIQARPVWGLDYLQKPYQKDQKYLIDNAIALVGSSLCLPSSTDLRNQDIERAVSTIDG